MGDDKGDRLKPTMVPIPARRERPAPPTAAATARVERLAPTILQPTVIAGASRERLALTGADLQQISAEAAPAVIETALRLLAPVVVEKVTERRAILWGHDIQKAFADAVAEALQLSQHPVMMRMQGHVTRLLDILGSFDLSAAARPQGGNLGTLLRAFNRKTDTVAEFAAARTELSQLAELMNEGLEPLLKVREQLQRNAERQQALAIEVEGTALAALYLSEHFSAGNHSLADRFLERSISLTQTLAQIRGDDPLRIAQVEGPLHIILAIQNVTLVSMPDFLANLTALGSRANRMVTPTDARELSYKLRHIVGQLQNEETS